MFQWTDVDVSNVVRLVLQSVRSPSFGYADCCPTKLIAALANQLDAVLWHAHTGHLELDGSSSTLRWSYEFSSQPGWNNFDPSAFYSTTLAPMVRALNEGDGGGETIGYRIDFGSEMPLKSSARHAISILTLSPSGVAECIEFVRGRGAEKFSLRDEAILRILSTELRIHPTSGNSCNDGLESLCTIHLPPRQREVLAKLIMGSSVKEIAKEMGITYYTVNDYVKALYHRFGVSSRAELVAAVLGLRRSVAVK